jgi:hypothetical protein
MSQMIAEAETVRVPVVVTRAAVTPDLITQMWTNAVESAVDAIVDRDGVEGLRQSRRVVLEYVVYEEIP